MYQCRLYSTIDSFLNLDILSIKSSDFKTIINKTTNVLLLIRFTRSSIFGHPQFLILATPTARIQPPFNFSKTSSFPWCHIMSNLVALHQTVWVYAGNQEQDPWRLSLWRGVPQIWFVPGPSTTFNSIIITALQNTVNVNAENKTAGELRCPLGPEIHILIATIHRCTLHFYLSKLFLQSPWVMTEWVSMV